MKSSHSKFIILAFLLIALGFSTQAFAATRTISNAGGNWSSPSAWAEGAVPTSADDVVATATSGNITIDAAASCRSVDLSLYTKTLTHNAFILSVGNVSGGSLNFSGTWSYVTSGDTSAITFVSFNNASNNITWGGKTFGNILISSSNNGTWFVLQDTLTQRASTTSFSWFRGNLNLNGTVLNIGNFTDSSGGAYTRSLTLGASNIILNGSGTLWSLSPANLTFNAGTSTITFSAGVSNNPTFAGASQAYNNLVLNGSGRQIISGSNTFANLSRIGTAGKNDSLSLGGNQVITGTFTVTGESPTNRVLVFSNTLGTSRTVTAGVRAVANADFRDIGGDGWDLSANTGGTGDCGGNSGITFTTAATQYWKHGGSTSDLWSNDQQWYTTSGGTTHGRVPLPQDDAVFDANSFSAAGSTVVADMPRLGKNIIWTGVANTPTFAINNSSNTMYGSLTLDTGMNVTSSTAFSFSFDGRGAHTLYSAGKSMANTLVTNTFGGSLTLQDNVQGPYQMTFNSGIFNANNFNVTAQRIRTGDFSYARTINMGSGTWTMTASEWNVISAIGLTINKDTSMIILADTSATNRVFTGGGLAYNNISITGGGTGTITLAGSSSFNDFTIGAPKTVTFTSGTTQTINGTFTAIGSAGNMITINATIAGSAATLSKASGTITGQYLSLKDSAASGGATWYANNSSINVSGNSGWIFPPRVISALGGDWNISTTWEDGVIPGAGDNVIATAGSGNLNITAAAACRSIDLSAYSAILTHKAFTLSVGDVFGGSLNFSGSWTYTTTADTSSITFVSTANNGGSGWPVTTGGKVFGHTTFNGAGGKWVLQDTFNSRGGTFATAYLSLAAGTFLSGSNAINCGKLGMSGPSVRTVDITNSTITVMSSNAGSSIDASVVTNLTFISTGSAITFNHAAALYLGNGLVWNNVTVFPLSTGSTFNSSSTFSNLTLGAYAVKTNSISFKANQSITGILTFNGESTINRLLLSSDTLGTARTITAANISGSVSNTDFRDITAAGTGIWDLSALTGGSGDCGGNSGITFTPAAPQYWKHGGSAAYNWSDSTQWFTTSGGPTPGRVPLPQDDAVFDANSFSAVGSTVVADMPRLGKSINWSGVTNTPMFSLSSIANTLYGSLTLVSGMALTQSQSLYFEGRDSYTLTTGGQVFTGGVSSLIVAMVGGTLTLQDDLTMGNGNSRYLYINNGTFSANNHNITAAGFISSNANVRAINMGSGTWTIANYGSIAWDFTNTTNLTFNVGTSTIIWNDDNVSQIFKGGGLVYNNLTINAGAATVKIIAGSNTFNNLTIIAPRQVTFTSGTTQTILGSFTALGSTGNLITLNSSTPGSIATLSMASGRVNSDYLSIKDVSVTGGAVWYAGANSSYAGGNIGTGWIFTSAPVFYSVAQSAADLKIAATLTITAGVATFSAAQTGNIGVGDRVTYGQIDITAFADQGGGITRLATSGNHGFQRYDYINISGTTNYNGTYQISSVAATTLDIVKAYIAEAGGATKYVANIAQISGKISQTVWSLITPRGGTPSARSGAVTVNSIRHEYTSLSAAIAGAKDVNHLNSSDLTAANVLLNIPCYYDSGADTTAVTVSGYTTGASNYIKIYTPYNTTTEANNSQRHQGKASGNNYLINPSTTANAIAVNVRFTQIEGLEITDFGGAGYNSYGIYLSVSNATLKNNIIHDEVSGNNGFGVGSPSSVGSHYILNNIIYNLKYGIQADSFPVIPSYVYNNTVRNASGVGFWSANNSALFKNNIAQNCADGFYGSYAGSNYNISDLAADAPGANSKNSTTVAFVDAVNKDFHLAESDSAARDAGTNLSADANLAFNTDIDGQTRPIGTAWEIGADEASLSTPPISAITAPASAAIINLASPNPYTISGSATDNVAVTGIEVSTNNGGSWNAATCIGCPGASVTWTYSWTVPADASYTIRSRATDSLANLESPAAGNTVIVDRTSPTISSSTPANLATGVARNASVTINWAENIDCSTVNTATITISGGGWVLSSCSGSQAVFDTSGQFGVTSYTVTVSTAVMDVHANAMTAPYVFSYTTVTPTAVYYSVGQSAADLKTGSPTVTISGGTAVFSVAQTGNIGVGDRVTYNTSNIAYIAAKTGADQMHWRLITATGGVPADIAGSTVVSIRHEYTSLSAAVGGAKDANHLNSSDLRATNTILNIPCYYDSGADTTAVTVSGYTTGASNYIKIYTPYNTATETNNSQRHQGKWNDTKYNLKYTTTPGVSNVLAIAISNVRVDGLQIKGTAGSGIGLVAIKVESSVANNTTSISNGIVSGVSSTSQNEGIWVYSSIKAWNNIIYGFNLNSGSGIRFSVSTANISYISNVTIYDCVYGLNNTWVGAPLAKNVITQNCTDGFYGAINAGSNYNISNKPADAPGANSKNATTVTFVDAANKDFHLSNSDTASRGSGINLSADPDLPFSTDIDGQLRPTGAWDIGADQVFGALKIKGNVKVNGGVRIKKY